VPGDSGAGMDPFIGRVIHDRYRVQSLVAVGEQWRVYRAVQSVLGRTVTIKVLSGDPTRPPHDRQLLERFMLQAARASRLTSPTTIAIFDYGRTDDGHHFIVMEDVEGVTLAGCLEREGRLSILPAVTIVGQVCLSLREAHAVGVVHRNVEPGNIVLVDGHYDQIKVLDFGLGASRSGLGTPGYMAPEALDGHADSRADIYAVGAVLYRSLCGRLPFNGTSATSTLLMAARERAPAIDPHIGVPRAIDQIVMACLDSDPERRPSIEDVLYGLQVGVLELHGAVHDAQEPASIHAEMEPVAEQAIAAVPPAAGAPAPATGWSARSVVKLLVAAAVLFSVGAALSLAVRFALSDRDAVDPAPPAARSERSAPAATVQAPATPSPAPAAVPDAATAPVDGPAPADARSSTAPEEADEEGRRRQRGAGRKRAPSADRPDRSRDPRDPVPEGYKESPY
jgi:eukaryotic-like serine/threonine-protein kinase